MPRLRQYIPLEINAKGVNIASLDNFEFPPLAGHEEGEDERQLVCGLCKEIIIEQISRKFANHWFTVEEQHHLDTYRHKQAKLLAKLSGEDR